MQYIFIKKYFDQLNQIEYTREMASVFFSFSMTREQRDLLAQIAAERGLCISALIRNWVRQEVEKTGRTWPRTRLEVAREARVRNYIEKEKKLAEKRRKTFFVPIPELTADGRYDARPKSDTKK
jgi:hypothetical protein